MRGARVVDGATYYAMTLACVLTCTLPASVLADDDDPAGPTTPPGRHQVELEPAADGQSATQPDKPVELAGWAYRSAKSANPRDGVPWELIATPTGEAAKLWHKGEPAWRSLPPPASVRGVFLGDRVRLEKGGAGIPVVEVPEVLWKQWMASDLQDVVGIHFHEFVTDDVAQVLYTLHKVPPDEPDGKPPADYKGRAGVRIEATLLAPVTYSLDQSIVLRVDPLEKELTEGRLRHETGHAHISQEVLLEVLRGPQDWNPPNCTGRRSTLAFYWRRELIGRSWDGYKDGTGQIATLRTTVALTPRTRWSMMLPIPPERVTQKHLQEFNNSVVQLGPGFARADLAAQDRFHSHRGAFEGAAGR